MSVVATYTPAQYNCNGSTTEFPFTFGVGESSEIEVVLTDAGGMETVLTETTHYTVSAVNNDYESGGTVTTVATYAEGYMITIRINVPLTQSADFVEGMPTLYESFENGLDKLTRIAQQLNEGRERTLIVPKTESSSISRVIPPATTRAGKILGFDASGQPVAVTEVEGITLTGFGNSLVSSADAEEARTTLELDNVTNDAQARADFTGYDEKLTSADDDLLLINDSADANAIKKMKIGVIKIDPVPAGIIIPYAGQAVPTGYLECNGAAVSRVTYATLFTALGTMYGAGDGSTTFNLPDYRGYFLRGWAHGETTDPDRATRTDRGDGTTGDSVGTKQNFQNYSHTHGSAGSHTHSYDSYGAFGAVATSGSGVGLIQGYPPPNTGYAGDHTHPASGGNESRPINVNVMYCIKY